MAGVVVLLLAPRVLWTVYAILCVLVKVAWMLSPLGSPSLPCSVRQCSACALHVTKVQLSNVRLPLADWALGTITSVCFFYCHLTSSYWLAVTIYVICQEIHAPTIAHTDEGAIESDF
jgi:hypothetical protein